MVDEVLSVGDAEFQRKCLGKMDEVTARGRTVIFVSHNLSAVTRLCSRALLLEGGRVVMDGPAPKVVGKYLSAGVSGTAEREWPDAGKAPRGDVARLRAVRIRRDDGAISDTIDCRMGFQIEMEYEILKPGYPLWVNFNLWNNEDGVEVFSLFDLDEEWRGRRRPVGHYRTCARVPGDLLGDGMFTLDVSLALRDVGTLQFNERGAVAFHVIDRLDGSTARGDWGAHLTGAVRPKLRWTTEVLSSGEPQPPLYAEAPRL
jgi:lipopolysaccharide transport system ATP-binding protein